MVALDPISLLLGFIVGYGVKELIDEVGGWRNLFD